MPCDNISVTAQPTDDASSPCPDGYYFDPAFGQCLEGAPYDDGSGSGSGSESGSGSGTGDTGVDAATGAWVSQPPATMASTERSTVQASVDGEFASVPYEYQLRGAATTTLYADTISAAGGTVRLTSITLDAAAHDAGDYSVVVTLDGRDLVSAPVTIEAPPTDTGSGSGAGVTARWLTEPESPYGPSDYDTFSFYVGGEFSDALIQGVLRGNGSASSFDSDRTSNTGGEKIIRFSLRTADYGPGEYQLAITFNGERDLLSRMVRIESSGSTGGSDSGSTGGADDGTSGGIGGTDGGTSGGTDDGADGSTDSDLSLDMLITACSLATPDVTALDTATITATITNYASVPTDADLVVYGNGIELARRRTKTLLADAVETDVTLAFTAPAAADDYRLYLELENVTEVPIGSAAPAHGGYYDERQRRIAARQTWPGGPVCNSFAAFLLSE